MFHILKKNKYVQLMLQKLTQIVENKEKEGCHYLAVKKLSALLRGTTSKHDGDFYWMNFPHSFRTKKLNLMKKLKK